MNVQSKTGPTAALLDLQEVKDHLRVTFSADDVPIQGLIDAVQDVLEGPEGQLGRTLVRQSWTMTLDGFPCARGGDRPISPLARAIEVPLPPLITVDAIKYLDAVGSELTLAPSAYRVQMQGRMPALIHPAPGVSWPATFDTVDAVTVDFTAGYGGPEALPPKIRSLALLMITHLYETRGVVQVGNIVTEIPMGARALIELCRVPRL